MMTNGATKVCGIIGCPVEHSMSPLMHNYYSEQIGNDMIYVPFLVQQPEVETAISGAHALHVRGINVTVPHKQAVMEHLFQVDEGARVIGAVNTLVWMEGGYKGYNTDAEGLARGIREAGMDIAGRCCILLGAGGAARAAAYILCREGAKRLYILNRSREKAEALAEEMERLFSGTICRGMALSEWETIEERHCLAVQTTSVGMGADADHAPVENPAFYQKLDQAFDVIYTPEETRFLKMAAAAGAKTANGLGMLIYQGVAAYELWNPGIKLSDELIEAARQMIIRRLEGQKR